MNPFIDLKVNSRESFIKFLEILHNDYLTNKETWENVTLDDFLEAMTRYAEDVQGYYDNTGQDIDANQPSWKVFADILKGASIYE